jgi:hypothetical protein
LLRVEPNPGYSVVYPLLISPAYLLFDSLPDAYAAVKTMNAVLMSLAAVPAFFVARRVVRTAYALLAALLAVAVPVARVHGHGDDGERVLPALPRRRPRAPRRLERPTPLWVVLLLALRGLAYATRVQAVALGPAILLAPLVLAVFEPRGLRSTSRDSAGCTGSSLGAARRRARRPARGRRDSSARTPLSANEATTSATPLGISGGTRRSSPSTCS